MYTHIYTQQKIPESHKTIQFDHLKELRTGDERDFYFSFDTFQDDLHFCFYH